MKKTTLHLSFAILIAMVSCTTKPETTRLFVGKYNESGEKGISIFDLDQEKGSLTIAGESEAGPNPAYLCVSKKHNLLYAANEVMNFNGGIGGGVTTLRPDASTCLLEKVNEILVPNGSPCYISLSPQEDFLFLANYTGGSIAVIKLDEQGIPTGVSDSVTFAPEGEKTSHAHMISFDPGGKKVYLADLGLDRIVIYDFDPVAGKLNLIENGIIKLPDGSGPRHFTFNSESTKMYVICELNSTISVFGVNEVGGLDSLQVISTLQEGFRGKSYCADIHIGKGGNFLYGSNRGENTIVTFRVGSEGLLSLAGHSSCGGDWPRNFMISPNGKFLLAGNQRSGNISVFGIDKNTGIPSEANGEYKLSSPACLKTGF